MYYTAVRCYHCILVVNVFAGLYNVTRRGLACVAYPYMGAMREPEYRDRRGETNSHVFFCFHTFFKIDQPMQGRVGKARGMDEIEIEYITNQKTFCYEKT